MKELVGIIGYVIIMKLPPSCPTFTEDSLSKLVYFAVKHNISFMLDFAIDIHNIHL